MTAGSQGITQVTWKAHLANRKAAFFKFDGQDGANGQWKGPETEPGVNDTANRLRNSHVAAANREWQLVIDPGEKSISGRNTPPVPFTNTKSHIPIKSLGELRTDENGHLLVLGGAGEAQTTKPGTLINNYVNNDHWFDDMADGPVSAEVTCVVDGKTQVVKLEGDTGAWVLVGPPDFAPSVGITVRLLDTLWDVAVRFPQEVKLSSSDGLFSQGLFARLAAQRADWDAQESKFKSYKPSFLHEVYPLLERALQQRQVHNPEASKSFHGSLAGVEQDLGSVSSSRGRRMRRTIFGYMRNPNNNTGNEPLLMPKGLGDRYSDLEKQPGPDYFMTLTRVQYAVLERWAAGEFVEDWDAAAAQAIPQAITAEGPDRAAMESSVGGPFFLQMQQKWSSLGFVLQEGELFFESQERSK
ncbi:LodA/GoxA family CTQ-dependent oxidase [Pyxidicoccus parkwayensis]|uniref:LodA/GoxA family CTQ-dependent oxidase n=1 Tax=Pyxidicoccus parkwayensis TaxID=2813578 RepID=UPI001F51075A|nr:LodA/GoxA family CTQ-dependent oxidase [Pyxidicoccus parkwaysis]